MDVAVKGRRGRKKSADKIHIGRSEPLSIADAIRTSFSKERHRVFYVSGGGKDLDTLVPEEGSFLIVCGDYSDASSCMKYLNTLADKISPKRIVYVPSKPCKDVKAFRDAIEGAGMAFLDDELMIFKDGSRYIYESADVMNATSPEIREEFAGSDFSILGAASIKRGGLYDHIKSNAPAANLLVVSGAFDTDYNVNWTYVSASILAFPDGMRVLDDVDGTVRFVDMPLKQTQSMSFKDGMMSMKAEEYRDFLKSLGMPSIYKTDKDVTFITKNG